MRKVVVPTVLCIAGLGATFAARAEEQSGFYLGASVGRKLGYAFYDSDATFRLGNLSERESNSDEDLAYGIGMELAISGGLRFRAEYEAVDVSEGDFQIVSAGAVYKF